MEHYIENDSLVICLEGRISSDTVNIIEEEFEKIFEKNPASKIIFDAEKLEYISSAGLRFLLKIKKEIEGKIIVRNVSSDVYDIFDMTGFTSILDVKKKMRNLSVEGCPIIGNGAMGTVYRIDEDTIIKVFNNTNNIDLIDNEIKKAKDAFLLGIPTAIPFDIVRVGNKYGAVFELIKAENCNDYLVRNLDKLQELCSRYADFIKDIHSVKATNIDLPEIKDMYLSHLEDVSRFLSDDLYQRTKNKILSIPDTDNVVHGDIQVKNIMISSEEMILIDMDTLSKGNPIFDFGGLYMTYITFNIREPDNSMKFLNLDSETCSKLLYDTLKNYYSAMDDAEYKELLKTITILGTLRFLFLVGGLGIGLPDLKEIRIKDCVAKLEELL